MKLDRDRLILRAAREETREGFLALRDQAANWQPGPMPKEWGQYESIRHHRRNR